MPFHHFKPSRHCLWLYAVLGLLVQVLSVMPSQAQYGVSPSQTGLFFDDLRARQRAEREASRKDSIREGEATYDYEGGVYRDTPEEPMGQRSVDYEDARELSRPAVRSGSAAYSARGAGDYTNYAGQYTSPTGFFAPTYVSDPFLQGRRNLKLGPVNVGFGLYQAFEYNDNVNRSGNPDNPLTPNIDEGPVSDFISSTLLSIDANYALTKNNRLSLTTAIGFDHYFEHPELAPYGNSGLVLNVLPGSTLAFDIKAGPVFITIYDRMSVRPATRNDFALTGNQVFGVFQNDAGIAANWRINSKWTLAVNLMHSTADAMQDIFEPFSRVTDSLHASLTFSPNGTWAAGIEGGSTLLDYKAQLNNDGVLNNIGVFVVIPVSSHTYLRVAGGYQNFDFENGQPALFTGLPPFNYLTNGDQSDLSDYYYTFTINNRLSSRVSQSLSVGHESSLNITSNYVTSDFANYGIAIIAWKGSRITLSAYVEDASMSGGVFAQDTFQYGFDSYLSHRLSSKWTVGLGYHYGITDVGQVIGAPASRPASFVQHAFNIDFNYALSRKANLLLGYRYYYTDVIIGPTGSFDQNRIMMALNYNF
jgi:hypothetical protein